MLGDPQIGGFQVQTLVNVASGQLQEGIEDFCADRHPDDQLLIYLFCHGVLNSYGRLYYAAANTRRQRLAATAVAATWLNERLEECRACRQILDKDGLITVTDLCQYVIENVRGAEPRQTPELWTGGSDELIPSRHLALHPWLRPGPCLRPDTMTLWLERESRERPWACEKFSMKNMRVPLSCFLYSGNPWSLC